MPETPNMAQSSNSASGTYTLELSTPLQVFHGFGYVLTFPVIACLGSELSFYNQFEKMLEKLVSKIFVRGNESIDKAIYNRVEKAVKEAVETIVDNAVKSAVESAVKKAVEYTVDTAVETAIEQFEKTAERVVNNTAEIAVKRSMARYPDHSQGPASAYPTRQLDSNQGMPEIDVDDETREVRQGFLEFEIVIKNSTDYNDDEPEHEEATL